MVTGLVLKAQLLLVAVRLLRCAVRVVHEDSGGAPGLARWHHTAVKR